MEYNELDATHLWPTIYEDGGARMSELFNEWEEWSEVDILMGSVEDECFLAEHNGILCWVSGSWVGYCEARNGNREVAKDDFATELAKHYF